MFPLCRVWTKERDRKNESISITYSDVCCVPVRYDGEHPPSRNGIKGVVCSRHDLRIEYGFVFMAVVSVLVDIREKELAVVT